MRRPDKRFVFLAVGGVLVAAVATMWFFNNYERKPIKIDSGQSPAAIQNPLLAATRFLQQLGLAAESYRGRDLLINLPPVEDTVFIYRQGGALSPTEMDQLLQWITDGGHLIVQPKHVLSSDDDPLETGDMTRVVDVRLRYRDGTSDCGCPSDTDNSDTDNSETDTSDSDTSDSDSSGADVANSPAGSRVNQDPPDIKPGPEGPSLDEQDEQKETGHEQLTVAINGTDLTVDFPNTRFLEKGTQEPVFRIDSEEQDGAYLLQYRIGRGKMTVLSSSRIFNNMEIDTPGRGWLLAWLAGGHSKVWLLYSNNMDSIFSFLCHHMPLFLFSLCGWVIFFGWSRQYRIGSIRDPKKRTRRHILTHIDGLGRFNWQVDRASSLLERVREPILSYWARRLPGKGGGRIDPEAVSRLTGLSESDVKTGLSGPVTTEQDLVVVTRCLQTLHRAGAARRKIK